MKQKEILLRKGKLLCWTWVTWVTQVTWYPIEKAQHHIISTVSYHYSANDRIIRNVDNSFLVLLILIIYLFVYCLLFTQNLLDSILFLLQTDAAILYKCFNYTCIFTMIVSKYHPIWEYYIHMTSRTNTSALHVTWSLISRYLSPTKNILKDQKQLHVHVHHSVPIVDKKP